VTLDASAAFSSLPSTLRDELINEFNKILRNYREGRWEAAELDGGRFSEVAYTVLAGYLAGGQYAARSSKPARFDAACVQLGNATGYPKSARISVPRVLIALYDIRNNRGVGHVGGDVSANHMDSAFVLHATQWIMAEFVRIFHGTDLATATTIVEALITRESPALWKVGDAVRILQPGMNLSDSTLLLLHGVSISMHEKDLARHLEQDRISNYRRTLRTLHSKRMIEFNEHDGIVTLSPSGIKRVEERILPHLE
jgi:hypothetical protein